MACPQIPEFSREEFERELVRKWLAERIPLIGSMELDLRCNLKCHHCYREGDWPSNVLETEEVIRILDQIADAGTLWLLFTGGEIFLRRDFFDIYEHALKRGLILTLFTNGTMLSEKIADGLAERPPHSIEITLYGYTQETYEKVTGVAGSYAKCYRGVELLLERGLHLRLKTIVMKTNRHEFMDMVRFADDRDVHFKWDTMINPNFNGSMTPCNVRLSPEETVEMDFALPARFEEFRDLFERQKDLTSNRVIPCGAGSRTFHIDPYGYMKMCTLMREPEFSLREMSFRQVWEEMFPPVYSRVHNPEHPCTSCNLSSLCGKCPGWSQLEKGSMEARVEHACEVGHRRAEKLGYYQGPRDQNKRALNDESEEILLPVIQ